MTTATIPVEVLAAMRVRARKQSQQAIPFTEFLTHVVVRSDDPDNPFPTAWQPWPYLMERAEAWERGDSEVILKARQLGFTWLIAAFYDWCARRGDACGHFSVGQTEARELLKRVEYIEMHLPRHLQAGATFRADDVVYPSGGSIRAFPSTEHAGISYTFQRVGMDEAAFHPYGAANYAAVRPTISAGGQFVALSTADPSLGPNGFFHDQYWKSKAGETPYRAVFVPWSARPDRDEAWYKRERAAYAGDPERFDAYYPDSDAAAFVGKAGLVYPMFSVQRHAPLDHPWRWEDSVRRVAGVDFGGGDPTAVVPLGLSGRHHVHQFGEFYRRGPVAVEEIAAFLSRYSGPGLALCDPSEPVAIETLSRALAGTGWMARAADNRRAEGLSFAGWMLDNDRLTIHASCRDSIAEFPGYRWIERTDPHSRERYATSTPVDNHADAMDARRYALLELMNVIRGGGAPVASLSGKPRPRHAV